LKLIIKLKEVQMNTKHAVFQLNEEDYGLDISEVNTVEKDVKLVKMENSPKNIKGKINLRGEDIPVLSLRRKFNFPDKEADNETRYLITNINGKNIALEVDQVKGIQDIDQSDVYEVPQVVKSNNTSYLKSIAKIDGDLILLLDNSKLLDTEEVQVLEKIKK